ncbi:MAG: fibronectin type III domain-containing protein [Planctomycetota bacterium]
MVSRSVSVGLAVVLAVGSVAAAATSQAATPRAVDGCSNPAAIDVASGGQLQTTLATGADGMILCITQDITIQPLGQGRAVLQNKSATIDGGGHSIIIPAFGEGLYFNLGGPDAHTLTIANVEFPGGTLRNLNSAVRVLGHQSLNDTLIVSNVSFFNLRTFPEAAAGVMAFGTALYADLMGRVDVEGLYVSGTLAQSPAPVVIQADQIAMRQSSFHFNRVVHDMRDPTAVSNCPRTSAVSPLDGPRAGAASLQAKTSATITDSIFWNNTADCGGALYLTQTASVQETDAAVTITNSSIAYNAALVRGGGGIFAERLASLTLTGTGVLANEAQTTGGGIDAREVRAIQITSSGVNFNETEVGDGGGINALSGKETSRLVVEASTVNFNTAGFSGGGIASEMGLTSLTGVKVSDNSALEGDGGGVYALEPDNVAAEAYRISVVDSSVVRNAARAGEGGGMRAIGLSPTVVTNATIANNAAKRVGGLDVPTGALTMQFATVTGNTATTNGGVGVTIAPTPASTIVNSIFWNNAGPSGAAGAAADLNASNGAANASQVTYSVRRSAASIGVPVGAGILTADPQLGDLGNNGGASADGVAFMPTRAPLGGSPVLGAGTRTQIAADQAGRPRNAVTPTLGALEIAVTKASAPRNVTAVAGDQVAEVSWTPPVSDGGAPITAYRIDQSDDGGQTWSERTEVASPTTTALMDGLENGTAYRFRVAALTSRGRGDNSAATDAVTPRVAPPGAPGRPTLTPGNGLIVIEWAPPANADVAGITGYRVDRSTDGGATWVTVAANTGSAGTQGEEHRLTNGTAYVYRVAAINAGGVGPYSDPSLPGVPTAALPGAPGRPSGEPGNGQVSLTWAPPVSSGDAAIAGYAVEYSTDGLQWTTAVANTRSAVPEATVNGLVNGTTYTFRVSAITAIGQGVPSANSAGITPNSPAVAPVEPGPAPGPVPGPPPDVQPQPAVPGTVASPPRDVTAVARNRGATVTWTAPASTGTYAVTRYWVTANPGGRGCEVQAPALTCSVAGLVNGTTYTFTVEAFSAAGWSVPSAPSNAVTPPGDESIEIVGKRGKVKGKKGLIVTGTSTGVPQGSILRPWIRFPGQASYTQGIARISVRADGTFEWSRKGNKKAYVYVATDDGSLRSNGIIVEPAPR